MRGIRSSTSGYKAPTDPAWKLGITIDGQINADRILTGTLMAGLIKAGILSDVGDKTQFNLETGDLVSRTSLKKLIMQQGYLRAYSREYDPSITPYPYNPDAQYYDELVGTLDLCASYGDGTERVALRSETELSLQAGTNEMIFENNETYTSKSFRSYKDIEADEKLIGGSAAITNKITCGSIEPANGATNNISWKQSNGLDVSITVKNGIITAINKTEPAPDPT
jgi:hypothetical protein